MQKLFFLLTSICITFLSFGQADDKLPLDSALNNILTQILLFPQEKIYLQTDKPYYISGEKIYFRVFLLNAFSHQPADMSRYVYVELINSRDSVAIRQQIRPENRLHYGTLALPEKLPQGDYKIRAYTRFMENIGEDYFFTQPVYIADPQADSRSVTATRPEEKFDVFFYPEGGNLIVGQSCAVAFKALSSDGNAIDVTGDIFDFQNNKITDFSTVHEGMGRFILKAETGERYHAVIWANGKQIKKDLPEVKAETFALATVWRQNKLFVSVKKPDGMCLQRLYVVIHTGGLVTYAGEWNSSGEFISIDKKNFPSGVSHLMLLTEDFRLLSERLVFALNDDWLAADVKMQKKNYGTRDLVKMDVVFNDTVSGNFAVSITDDKDIKIDTTSNILTAILLTSELKGYIANPAYYFQKDNRQAELAADLLMMTHGWTRYDIPRAMRGDFRYLAVPNEESQSISGIVKGGLFSKPYKGGKVTLLSIDNAFFDQTETDENGRFVFKNFEFPDSIRYTIQALTRKGDYTVEVYTDTAIYPKACLSLIYPKPIDENASEEYAGYIAKAELKYTYENGKRTVYLPEVTIKSTRKEKKYQSPYYREADHTISEEMIEKSAAASVSMLLSRIPRLIVTDKMIKILGNESFNSSDGEPPLIKIDGMIVGTGSMEDAISTLNMLNTSDIAQIDVLKNTSKLSIYGSLGANGVIEIFTKRPGEFSSKLKFNVNQIRPLGYQLPVEFYSPRYDTPETRKNAIPDLRSTIYWKPNVQLNASEKTSLDFYTADTPSAYSAVIEGITDDGKLIYQRKTALIKVE
jgi:TonB-dependent SusC/RagA subfamily outer membrane receptor